MFQPEHTGLIHTTHHISFVIPYPHRRDILDYKPAREGETGGVKIAHRHFLQEVVTPIYNVIKAEVGKSEHNNSYSSWRNYDDLNEAFWTQDAAKTIRWPLGDKDNSNFFKWAKGKWMEPPVCLLKHHVKYAK